MDYHLNSDDESLFAGMELPLGTAAGQQVGNGSSGGTLEGENVESGMIEEGGANDTGFGEASFISKE